MRNLLTVGVAVGLALLGVASARADTTLLSLTDMPGSALVGFPGSGGTPYDLSFVATASTTTLSVAGDQAPGFWEAQSNSVTTGGGPNLLGGVWTEAPASMGSVTGMFSDGTAVPALFFAATMGLFDTWSPTFATTPGATYTYTFDFLNTGGTPSGLLITTSGSAVSVIPEPST
jgi:hypothetical protein